MAASHTITKDLLTDFTQFPEPDLHVDLGHWVRKHRNVDVIHPSDVTNGRCLMAFNEYVAGALGGMAGVVVGHPFDTMKIQMQIRTAGEHKVTKMSEAWNCIKSQGLKKGIFRGMMFPFCSYGVVNSLLFGVYGNTLDFLEPDMTVKPSYFQVGDWCHTLIVCYALQVYLAGCIAGTVQLVVACPIEVVKCTLQAQIPLIKPSSVLHERPAEIRNYYNGPIDCTKDVYRREGIRGFYKGVITMFARVNCTVGQYLQGRVNCTAGQCLQGRVNCTVGQCLQGKLYCWSMFASFCKVNCTAGQCLQGRVNCTVGQCLQGRVNCTVGQYLQGRVNCTVGQCLQGRVNCTVGQYLQGRVNCTVGQYLQ
ncbi:hypothetical protein Btru_002984, partial [Bulinus truncatus]